ncbi:FxsB family cyclophane-forming radical SAM/SPASM peptide maturase [Actinoplanes sp. CA-030573]|uniref:FxsB family cyclophane-forming radical SAM/SPASM peptide maturase n=1 Tax=Actinoplanes sp. CA-030573 TaxID=3239898 RepID=UPI003D926AAF
MTSREWPANLQVADDFRPHAFREFVLKIHQRCNLACDYCYVYTMGDDTWRDRPTRMSVDVVRTAAARIAEHADAHDLRSVRVVLHGGEPLLAGRDRLVEIIATLKRTIGRELRLAVQTNGVLLDEAMLDLFRAEGVEVGISLDGTGADNDRHRRYADGRGSAVAVERALGLLAAERYRAVFAGILCTVDIAADPLETYETLLRYRPKLIDFLLPHANWARPPVRPAEAGETAYGDWLVSIFDRWYDAPRIDTRVRILEEIISLVLGGASRSEQIGLSPVTVAVIESDGDIEQVDSLKSAYPGACATGLNVATDSFDRALRHPGIVARQLGAAALGPDCVSCPIHQWCGAGHYAHRYRPGSGFRNRSVYCADLARIITHVRRRVAADLVDQTGRRGE